MLLLRRGWRLLLLLLLLLLLPLLWSSVVVGSVDWRHGCASAWSDARLRSLLRLLVVCALALDATVCSRVLVEGIELSLLRQISGWVQRRCAATCPRVVGDWFGVNTFATVEATNALIAPLDRVVGDASRRLGWGGRLSRSAGACFLVHFSDHSFAGGQQVPVAQGACRARGQDDVVVTRRSAVQL